jgi:hypothetical protein
MRRSFRRIGFLSAFALLLGASPSIAAVPNVTYLSYKSAPGDVVGEGKSGQLGPADGVFGVVLVGPNGVRFNFQSATDTWTIDLDARDARPLLAGPYKGASDARYHSPTKPGIRATRNGLSCDWAEGSFKLLQLKTVGLGVQQFAADLDQNCQGSAAILHLELRFNADLTFPNPADGDADGIPDTLDNCLNSRNVGQADDDFDLLGDPCDPTVDNTFVDLESDKGDPLGGGQSTILRQVDGTIKASHDAEKSVRLDFDGDTDWSFFFGAPEGEVLEANLYQGALPPDVKGPEMLVSLVGRECKDPSGLFEIHEIELAPDGVVTKLAVDFVQSCGGAPPLRGSVRYRATDALMLRPKPNTTLDSSTVTFEWSDHVSDKKEFWLYIGTKFGSLNILDSGSLGARTSLEVKDLPTDGKTLYVRLWARTFRGWRTSDYVYTAAHYTYIPEIVSPVPESTLPGSTVRFQWTASGLAVTSWQLHLGSHFGGWDLFQSGGVATNWVDVSGLPTDGSAVFARLWYLTSNKWTYRDFQFVSDASGGTPELVSPKSGDVLPGSDVQLDWTPNGSVVSQWQVFVGSTKGNWDIYKSASLAGSTRSFALTGLPTDGSAVHVRLWYVTGSWYYKDYDFKAADIGGYPELTTPQPGSVLPGADVTFGWKANGSIVSQWLVHIGSKPGGYDLYQGAGIPGATTSLLVTGLPTDGTPIYVRLWYVNGAWHYLDYQFTAADIGGKPALVSPTPGSVLPGGDATFSWLPNGSHVSNWLLYIGSTAGGYDLYKSATLAGATTTLPVSGLPTDGTPVYVRLWYANGSWSYLDYAFTASSTGGLPGMTAPVPGTPLPGSQVDFSWSANGSKVSSWRLQVGATRWGTQFHDTGYVPATTTKATVSGLPTDGTTVFVTLWYQTGGGTFAIETQYRSSAGGGTPHILSPVAGTTLIGDTVVFQWTTGGSVVKAWWLNIGNAPGTNDLVSSGQLAAADTSFAATGLPTDGRDVWVQLWYQMENDSWTRVDAMYVAATN